MSDIATQAAQAPKGQEYGEAEAQLERQITQPVAGPATQPGASSSSGGGGGVNALTSALSGLEPGGIPGLSDPSAFPDEPLTAGLPSGPGPGSSALKSATFGPPELSVMRALFLKYPNDDIRRLIEWTETNLG